MKPRTIICVIGSLNVGGAERQVVQVLPRLDRSRWNPLVFCLSQRGELATQLEAEGIAVLSPPAPAPSKGASRLRRTLRMTHRALTLAQTMRELKPAIAHFFLPEAYILGAPTALLMGVPVRIMSRRSVNDYQGRLAASAWIESWLHPTMTAILANSRRVAEQLRDDERVPSEKLGLIYNGVNVSAYLKSDRRATIRASLGIEPEAVVFIVVANLLPYKGHRDLLAAFSLAAERLAPGWRLLIIGRDEGIWAALREQAALLGMADNVAYLGARRDVADLLQGADVNILSSHEEGFSNSVLESMAAGLPSIVTDVGGNAEAVVDGESGLVVPPRDLPRLAAAIEKLAADCRLRAAMGKNARRRVEQNFTLETCVAQYEVLYDALMRGRKPIDMEGIRVT